MSAPIPETKPLSALRRITPQTSLPPDIARAFNHEEMRVIQRRLDEPAECVYDETFKSSSVEREILSHQAKFAPSKPSRKPTKKSNPNDDSGLDLLASQVPSAAPDSEDERRIFRKLNYCRYRVMRVLRDFRGKELTLEGARDLLMWESRVRECRGDIVRLNMPLVLAMAKRTKITNVDPSDLVSEGNLALLRSVDKFDTSRGFKFSTYACRAILKSFSRVASRVSRYRGYFPTEFDPTLEKSDYLEQRRRGVEDDCVVELKNILGRNLANLNAIEKQVIEARFALDEVDALEPTAKTLEEVGELIGVTKERVRQIQNKALLKLKVVLEDGLLSPT